MTIETSSRSGDDAKSSATDDQQSTQATMAQDSDKVQDPEKSQVGAEGPDAYGPAPDGGVKAWLVIFGASCIFFSCLGFLNTFGVFQEYYIGHQLSNRSPDDIAWIGSMTAFIQFAAGAIGGPMFDRYGGWIIRPAAIVYLLGIMMLSLCKEYWQFMLCQGVLMGLGAGFLQYPAFGAVSQYFDKKRATALGAVVSGSSIGGIVFPIGLSRMLNSTDLGFGWSVRIMGFVITPLLIVACFVVTARLPPRRTRFFLPSAFRESTYVLTIAGIFFSLLGMFTPLFFIPVYAVSRGMSPTLAGYMLAILNAASTFGRIIPGILADKYGRLNIMAAGSLSSGITILCFTLTKTNAGIIVYSVFAGFTTGTIISGASAALSVCTENAQELGTYLGMGLGIASISVLIGPPINGALVDKYGGFLQVSILSGVSCLVGGAIILVCKTTTPKGLLGKI